MPRERQDTIDEDEAPTRPRAEAIATTPAPIDYAEIAAMLASVPRVVADPEDVGWFEEDTDVRALLPLLDGKSTVAEIAARFDSQTMMKTLAKLEERGIVERTRK